VTVGEALAEARYRAGLTVDEVSERTRIREAVIRCIEQDDYDACGGDLYVRGYVRAIAGAVGIDAQPLIREFDAAQANGPSAAPGPFAPQSQVAAAPAAPAAAEPAPARPSPVRPAPVGGAAAVPGHDLTVSDLPAVTAGPAFTVADPGSARGPGFGLAGPAHTLADPRFRLFDPVPGDPFAEPGAGYPFGNPDPGFMTAEPVYRVADPAFTAAEPTFTAAAETAFAAAEPTFTPAEPTFTAAEPMFTAAAEPAFTAAEGFYTSADQPFGAAEPTFTASGPTFTAGGPVFAAAAPDSAIADPWGSPPEKAFAPAAPAYSRPASPSAWRGRIRSRRWAVGVLVLVMLAAAAAILAGTHIVSSLRHTPVASSAVVHNQKAQSGSGTGAKTTPGGAKATKPPAKSKSGNPGTRKPKPKPKPHPVAPPVRSLPIALAAAFGPEGTSDGDNPQGAMFPITPGASLPWQTHWYTTADFGLLKHGTGLLLDMGKTVTVTSVRIDLSAYRGADLQLQTAGADLARLRVVASASDVGGTVRLRLAAPVRARYVLIWFTLLPPDGQGTYRESIYHVVVNGRR
jgi:Helix-turn-helix domain